MLEELISNWVQVGTLPRMPPAIFVVKDAIKIEVKNVLVLSGRCFHMQLHVVDKFWTARLGGFIW